MIKFFLIVVVIITSIDFFFLSPLKPLSLTADFFFNVVVDVVFLRHIFYTRTKRKTPDSTNK